MREKSAKRRKRAAPIPMQEWKVCVLFAIWLALEKNYDDIVVNIPKATEGGFEDPIRLLRKNNWYPVESENRVFAQGSKLIRLMRTDGKGDVIAIGQVPQIVAECKGWNRTDDCGTRALFNECIGQALATRDDKASPWVVFASTEWFAEQCQKVAALQRVRDAKLHFALVNHEGDVMEVRAD